MAVTSTSPHYVDTTRANQVNRWLTMAAAMLENIGEPPCYLFMAAVCRAACRPRQRAPDLCAISRSYGISDESAIRLLEKACLRDWLEYQYFISGHVIGLKLKVPAAHAGQFLSEVGHA